MLLPLVAFEYFVSDLIHRPIKLRMRLFEIANSSFVYLHMCLVVFDKIIKYVSGSILPFGTVYREINCIKKEN